MRVVFCEGGYWPAQSLKTDNVVVYRGVRRQTIRLEWGEKCQQSHYLLSFCSVIKRQWSATFWTKWRELQNLYWADAVALETTPVLFCQVLSVYGLQCWREKCDIKIQWFCYVNLCIACISQRRKDTFVWCCYLVCVASVTLLIKQQHCYTMKKIILSKHDNVICKKTYTRPVYYYKQNRISCKGTLLNANLTHVVRCVASPRSIFK